MRVYNSYRAKSDDLCHDGRSFSQPAQQDDEADLWKKFEAPFEDSWNDDVYSFNEAGLDELDIPPKAGALIDRFPSLDATGKGHILDLVKQLIVQEMSRR